MGEGEQQWVPWMEGGMGGGGGTVWSVTMLRVKDSTLYVWVMGVKRGEKGKKKADSGWYTVEGVRGGGGGKAERGGGE